MATVMGVYCVQGDDFPGAFLAAESADQACDKYEAEYGPCEHIVVNHEPPATAEEWEVLMKMADDEPIAEKLRRITREG